MYYLLYLVIAVGVFFYMLAIDKKFNKGHKVFNDKLAVYLLIACFVVRYFCFEKTRIFDTEIVGRNVEGLSGFAVVFTMVAEWLSITAFVLVALKPFFSIRTVDLLTKYFVPIASILNICLINNIVLVNTSVGSGITLHGCFLALEVGLELAFAAKIWFDDIKSGKHVRFEVNKRELINCLLALLCMLLATMPPNFIQTVFGFYKGYVINKDLSPIHRLFIYAGIILPFLIYFGLRDKSEAVIRFSLIFFSVGGMISYSLSYSYTLFYDLSAWPFHLCNTAMYVIPLCLIFKMNRLFYFTYFINVLGAFFAMAMPNYSETSNIVSADFLAFWLNHWMAFFMPLILVALKQFKRPVFKQFTYSMIGFFAYFIFVLFLNVYFTAHGKEVDYFFINTNFIADKLGRWAEKLFEGTFVLSINGLNYVFHPLYQLLFYLTYVAMGFGMWFIYELFFSIADSHYDMHVRSKAVKLDKLALKARLGGRSISEPMNNEVGIKLELKNFSKRYATSSVYAVRAANLEVFGGEIFGFLGPNGAGKSTIIKSIVGIQPITEGSIEVCGYDCATQSVEVKRLIGYVPDHYALYEKLSGREYINYIADIFEVSEVDRNERIERYIKLFELESSIDSAIRTYSHGMKQKITIMAALVHNPKVWILDEPLTGLDPNSIYQVKECMRQHAAEGNIVFFSSHIMEVVEKLCDRITIIKHGEIQCTKTISEIEKICPLEEFYLRTIGAEDLLNMAQTANTARKRAATEPQVEKQKKEGLFKRLFKKKNKNDKDGSN